MSDDEYIKLLVQRHFPGAQLLSVMKMTGGVSANVSKVSFGFPDGRERHYILREHGPTHCGHGADVEFHVLAALHKTGLPVPKPLAYDASVSHSRYPYLVLEFIDGSTDIPALSVSACIAAMADQLAAIHDTPTASLPALPERLDPIPELLCFLPDSPEWQGLKAKLLQLKTAPHSGIPTLLHGDFWPQNIIWKSGRIAAILDWEDAAIGDPLSDVACTCLELRYVHGAPGEQSFKQAYSAHRALDPFRFALWQAYVAAAAIRGMGQWGLEPSREVAMRNIATESIREAANALPLPD